MKNDTTRQAKVLIGCEFSGIVREAFNSYSGVQALSCDLLPPEDERTDYHYQGDVIDLLKQEWDLAVFFPPCTHLAVSGARWFESKKVEQRKAIWF